MKMKRKKILVIIALTCLIFLLGYVGYYAYLINNVVKTAEELERDGYTFNQPPPVIHFTKTYAGQELNWGWGKAVFPKCTSLKIENPHRIAVLIEADNYSVAFMHVDKCDTKTIKQYFGKEIFSNNYDPSQHTDDLMQYLKDKDLDGHPSVLSCSYKWWLYSQSMERYDFWDLFWGGAEIANSYMVKMILLPMFYKDVFIFETDKYYSALRLAGKNVFCSIWSKTTYHHTEFVVDAHHAIDSENIAMQIVKTFEFLIEDDSNENEIKKIMLPKLEANKCFNGTP